MAEIAPAMPRVEKDKLFSPLCLVSSMICLGTRSVLRRQSTTVGCLLSSRRHADAESRITSTAMRWLPRSHLGGDRFAHSPTQDLHSMRAERWGNRADAALAAVCNRKD